MENNEDLFDLGKLRSKLYSASTKQAEQKKKTADPVEMISLELTYAQLKEELNKYEKANNVRMCVKVLTFLIEKGTVLMRYTKL
jgi:hypothetical protein